MKKIIFIAAAVLALSSCSIFQRTSRSIYADPSLHATITAADLDISPVKVSGDTDGMNDGSKLKGSKSDCEQFAVAKALEKVGADVMVEPRFTYKYTNGKLKKVSVTGYPATYKNFRKATCEDLRPCPPVGNCCGKAGHKCRK